MKRLGVRVERVKEALPKPPPPVPPIDPSRLSTEQIVRMAELQERWLAVELSGLTDAELDEVIAVQKLLAAPDLEEA